MNKRTLHARKMASSSKQNKMVKSEIPRASLRSLIWTLVTSTFLLVHQTSLLATTAEASTTGDLPWTDFEKGLRDSALDSERLKPCLRIEDAGLRAGCSLTAALETEVAAAAATTKKEFVSESSKLKKEGNVSQEICAYREQGGPSLHKFAAKMHPYLKKVLERYATLHRECTELEYEKLQGMYNKKKSPQCRYVVWSCTFGLGNKLMSLLSTFLYAILSQRVLLIDSPGWEHLFCEPFPGSPLQIPKGFSLSEDMAPTFADFRNTRCTDSSRKQGPCSSSPYVVELRFTGVSQPEDHAFLVCPTAMAAVRQIPFLHFRNSNQHFAVGFFLNPALRPLLELLFPEHNVFHMLAQAFLSPSDVVWVQIKHFHEQYLQLAYRNVGVQLRESKGEYRKYYDEVVPLCIQSKAALCPIELEEQKELEQQLQLANSESSPNSEHGNDGLSNFSRPLVSVYVSSLVGGHYESLKQSVVKLEPEMRQHFVVVAQEADWEQREDTAHMQKALVDMWVLSLSDVLLTSHMSTFGYTAQGLGGLTPFHLKPWLDSACWLAASSDPCFHFAPHHVNCGPLDHNFTLTDPLLQVPYIVPCPDLPQTGLQLTE